MAWLKKALTQFCNAYYWYEWLTVALCLAALGGYLFYLAWKMLVA